MILNEAQRKELEELSRPLLAWINDNLHPHVLVILEPDRVQLFEGVCSTPIKDYIKD
jgi:hypothetical protein